MGRGSRAEGVGVGVNGLEGGKASPPLAPHERAPGWRPPLRGSCAPRRAATRRSSPRGRPARGLADMQHDARSCPARRPCPSPTPHTRGAVWGRAIGLRGVPANSHEARLMIGKTGPRHRRHATPCEHGLSPVRSPRAAPATHVWAHRQAARPSRARAGVCGGDWQYPICGRTAQRRAQHHRTDTSRAACHGWSHASGSGQHDATARRR